MKRWAYHIYFWLAYVAFKTYLNISSGAANLVEGNLGLDFYAVLVIAQLSLLFIKIPLTYFSFYAIDCYLGQKWALPKTIGILSFAFLISMIGMNVLNHQFILPVIYQASNSRTGMMSIGSLVYHFFTLAFVVGGASAIRLLRRQYRLQIYEAELMREKRETELKYLKSQINPHFLFNTLNNIYSLARKGSEATADSVLKLSKLMRFMLYEAGQSRIKILDEIKLIEDYIALEKLRYTNRLSVNFNYQIDKNEQEIAPLLLIHFVENAFKHGVSETFKDSSVSISIELKDNVLQAIISNSIAPETVRQTEKPVGLENIRRQLELLYPLHELTAEQNNGTFHVRLKIPMI